MIKFLEDLNSEHIIKAIVILTTFVILCFIIMGVINISQPKVFKGYYLSAVNGCHKIYIDWDNRLDGLAFKSTDPNVTLEVFKELQKEFEEL